MLNQKLMKLFDIKKNTSKVDKHYRLEVNKKQLLTHLICKAVTTSPKKKFNSLSRCRRYETKIVKKKKKKKKR